MRLNPVRVLVVLVVLVIVVLMAQRIRLDEEAAPIVVRTTSQPTLPTDAWALFELPPSTTTTTTAAAVVARSQPRPAPALSRVEIWEAIRRCECPQGWHCNTGNGYYGGLQFSAATWRQAGGARYAPFAHQATREQQIAIADAWQRKTSWHQWPTCARRLGLI